MVLFLVFLDQPGNHTALAFLVLLPDPFKLLNLFRMQGNCHSFIDCHIFSHMHYGMHSLIFNTNQSKYYNTYH